MSEKIYCGIDNGVSGTIGIIYPDGNYVFIKTPIFKESNYTKTQRYVNRIDHSKLKDFLLSMLFCNDNWKTFVLLERPMINSMRFQATVSAVRALESTLVIVESLNLAYQYEDSKAWQKLLLPKGLKKEQLKKASFDIGNRLFPNYKEFKHPDRDGLLLAEYGKRMNF